jgi:demethylmenaquinone methyltransferase/2-methoxy-6-polyprenyl-1,4-benzoquinol methylase
MEEDALLQTQLAYYRARAAEYDEWFFRTGRYDRGPEHRAAWLAEVATVDQALRDALAGGGEVLEMACGTGLWTQRLIQTHGRVVAVDASPEAIAINRERVQSDRVEYVEADLFSWTPPKGQFDAVFFGFWLSHVPRSRFDAFWAAVRLALKPSGSAFFIDSLPEGTSTAIDQAVPADSDLARRRLNDGREFDIVKVFHEPAELEGRLRERGWRGWVRSSGRFFIYGLLSPQS